MTVAAAWAGQRDLLPDQGRTLRAISWVREDFMQDAQSRVRARKWIGRGGLAALAGLIAFGFSPALPALAATWSSPVQLPGSCGSSVAVNQAGAMAAGGTFKAADGTTHVQVCTSPDGKTWQATDLGPGGDQPHGGQHPAVALSPNGRAVALWGSTVGCPAACAYILQASVRPPGGGWGAPVTLSTELNWGAGGIALSMDGSGDAIAAWVGFYADASHYAVLPAGSSSWGPAQTLSTYVQGHARNLSLAVSPDGNAVVAYATDKDAIWAVSGTVSGGFSAPVFVAAGDYGKNSAPKVALDDAGQASLVWSESGRTEAATRSPGGTWSAPAVLASASSSSVATAVDGAGNAIAVFGSSYSWHLAGGGWGPVAALPSGSAGGLVVADSAGTFVYADSGGNAFTFAAGATSCGAGSGSRGSLADLKIVPGLAVMLAAGAVSAETVN
jgi:hypothetical protein